MSNNKIIGKIKVRDDCDSQTIDYPLDGTVMSLQYQDGAPCIWAHGDFNKLGKATLYIVPTGAYLEDIEMPLYIGTLQEGPFVWHYFLSAPEKPNGVYE